MSHLLDLKPTHNLQTSLYTSNRSPLRNCNYILSCFSNEKTKDDFHTEFGIHINNVSRRIYCKTLFKDWRVILLRNINDLNNSGWSTPNCCEELPWKGFQHKGRPLRKEFMWNIFYYNRIINCPKKLIGYSIFCLVSTGR